MEFVFSQKLPLVLLTLFTIFSLSVTTFGAESQDGYVFVILNQQNVRHSGAAQHLAQNITDQAKQLSLQFHIHVAEHDWPDIAAWTYYPIIEKVPQIHGKNSSWIIILEEWSNIRVKNLHAILSKYNSKKMFLGNSIRDASETIIHHFDRVDKDQPFLFPDTRAGFAISMALSLSLAKRWSDLYLRPKLDFAVDSSYEFARFVESDDIHLTHHDDFCINNNVNCAVSFTPGETCKGHLKTEEIHFAVKTCSKFHSERIPVLEETWLKDSSNYALYSDIEDLTFKTVGLGIPNTETGHCGKTMAIIRHTAQLHSLKWLAIVDDDTLLSVLRLKTLLSCYDPNDMIAIGERYGFHPLGPYGYDYMTGGSGMVLSMELVRLLAEPEVCECPTNQTPDDMFLGVCLKRLAVPIIHSRLFHQSRPMDYSLQLLGPELPVSFHKYWMVNPQEVYSQWLKTADHYNDHDEL